MMIKSKRKLLLTGHVGKEPERKAMPSGNSIVTFSVATKHSKPDGNGGYIDETDWTSCKLIGEKGVDLFMKHVGAGTYIDLEGELRTEHFKSNGQDRHKEVLYVEDWNPLSKKKDAAAEMAAHAGGIELPE